MSAAVLDTNIMIDLNAGLKSAQMAVAGYDNLIISRIAFCEYLVGYSNLAKRQRLGQILEDSYKVIEINQDIAWRAVDLRLQYRLKLPDALIYATARSLDVPFFTRNTKDFDESMPGVHIPYVIEE